MLLRAKLITLEEMLLMFGLLGEGKDSFDLRILKKNPTIHFIEDASD